MTYTRIAPKLFALACAMGLSACVAVVPVGVGPSAGASAPVSVSRASGFASDILTSINAERAKNGLSALSYNASLQAAAQSHANDLVRSGIFSHTGSDGSTVTKRVKAQGYTSCLTAENISKGYSNASAIVAAWMASAGHKRNILHRNARQLGVAQGAGNTVVAVFAAPC